jgi:hypothetical protein
VPGSTWPGYVHGGLGWAGLGARMLVLRRPLWGPEAHPQLPRRSPALLLRRRPLPAQPWRLTADSLVGACKASLDRLQLQQVALYMQHWPGFFFNAFSNDAYLEGLARCGIQQRPLAPACCGSSPAPALRPPAG